MAIKKKETKAALPEIPAEINELLKKGFTEQFLKDRYESLFKETKEDILKKIEVSDEIEITHGEGFKCEFGSITISERKSYDYDKDALAGLVNSGKITVEQLLSFVSTFKTEDAQKTLSKSTFDTLTKEKTTETFTFKASSDFKAKCEEAFVHDGLDEVELKREATPVKKSKTPILDAVKEGKAKELARKITSKKAAKALEELGAEDEIDAILKG